MKFFFCVENGLNLLFFPWFMFSIQKEIRWNWLKFEMELLIFLVDDNLEGLGYYASSLCVIFFLRAGTCLKFTWRHSSRKRKWESWAKAGQSTEDFYDLWSLGYRGDIIAHLHLWENWTNPPSRTIINLEFLNERLKSQHFFRYSGGFCN